MNGVAIIAELLEAAAPIATVPVGQIAAGKLADGAPLDSLLIRSVSTIEHVTLKRAARVRFVERVSVTVRAATYLRQIAVMTALPSACAGKTGSFAGATGVSILHAGKGPDVIGPGDTFEQTIDFRVGYEIPA